MSASRSASIPARIVGVVALAAGLAAFLAPLRHAGPYGIPGRGLVGGILCLAIAAVLLAPRAPRPARLAAYVATPIALFFALYAAFAELEEVVVLYTPTADLRLWIVDDADGTSWVVMPRAKADAHVPEGARLELLRGGEVVCVVPRVVADPATNRRTLELRKRKYAVQRLAMAIGLHGEEPGPETVSVRLDPCE